MGTILKYFLYMDESGDPGVFDQNRPKDQQSSDYFSVTGLIVPVDQWREYLQLLIEMRKQLKQKHGIPIRAELHGSEIIHPRGNEVFSVGFTRRHRADMYRTVLKEITSRMENARIISVFADKKKMTPIEDSLKLQEICWSRLIQRFHTFLKKSGVGNAGMIFSDDTNEPKLRTLLRKMRIYNQIPSRFSGSYSDPVTTIIEDPIMRSSRNSYYIQIADLIVHALYRQERPKGSLKKYNVDTLYKELDPILLKAASSSDAQGIVRI